MECLAIGSLPYDNPQKAIAIVQNYFSEIPFWPQLAAVDKKEDMTIQYIQGVPGIKFNYKEEKYYCE